MSEYEQELKNLGVELKDYYTGLIDFPVPDGRPRGLPVLAAGRARSGLLARARRRLRGPAETAARTPSAKGPWSVARR